MLVRLEVRDPFIDPEVDHAGGVLRAGQHVILEHVFIIAIQKWPGDVDCGSRHLAGIDLPLEVDLGIRFPGARRTNSSDPIGQEKPGGGKGSQHPNRWRPGSSNEWPYRGVM